MSNDIPRTKAEAVLDVRYQMRLHFLHRRFYNRMRAWVASTSLIAGSAAVVSAFRDVPGALLACGLIVAVAGAADLVFRWAERAAKHDTWRRDLAAFLANDPDLPQIEAVLIRHDGTVDDEIEALRLVALNDNARSNGHEDWVRPEGFAERIMRCLA
jgi:hypothetical protein